MGPGTLGTLIEGESVNTQQAVAPILQREGMPPKDPLFKNLRYWPAVRFYLDRRYGLGAPATETLPALDGEERWDLADRPKRRQMRQGES